jgi:hypothetical protein
MKNYSSAFLMVNRVVSSDIMYLAEYLTFGKPKIQEDRVKKMNPPPPFESYATGRLSINCPYYYSLHRYRLAHTKLHAILHHKHVD